MNIIVQNLVTNYHLQGKGKTVVILHGWGDNMRGLLTLQSTLAKQYQILAVDLPGFGGTQPPKQTWGLDEYAQFVADVLGKLELKDVYAIIGHSNGGAIAIRGIATGVLHPSRLVLLAAAGIRSTQSTQKFAIKLLTKAGKVATFWLPARQKQRLRTSLYRSVGSDMLVVPELQETFKKTVSQDVQADAQKISIPTMLIYGLQDDAAPVDYGRTYHSLIQNSTLLEVDDAGHFVHLDQPEKVTKTIQEFLV